MLELSGCAAASITGFCSTSQHLVLPVSSIIQRWSMLKIVNLLFHKICIRSPSPTFSTSHFSSRPPPPPLFFLGFSKSRPLISRPLLSSKWFSNLPALRQASNWISKFLPTNRKHRISNFAPRHDNS